MARWRSSRSASRAPTACSSTCRRRVRPRRSRTRRSGSTAIRTSSVRCVSAVTRTARRASCSMQAASARTACTRSTTRTGSSSIACAAKAPEVAGASAGGQAPVTRLGPAASVGGAAQRRRPSRSRGRAREQSPPRRGPSRPAPVAAVAVAAPVAAPVVAAKRCPRRCPNCRAAAARTAGRRLDGLARHPGRDRSSTRAGAEAAGSARAAAARVADTAVEPQTARRPVPAEHRGHSRGRRVAAAAGRRGVSARPRHDRARGVAGHRALPRPRRCLRRREKSSRTPEKNSNGSFSIARQLGLGVSRIVIDPGHGGHDPGATGKDVGEAELVLDVSLRLEKLLQKIPGIEVVLTRRTDDFVTLQERTAIANREGADLFLSIHANAQRQPLRAEASRPTSSTSRTTSAPRPWPRARTRPRARRWPRCPISSR